MDADQFLTITEQAFKSGDLKNSDLFYKAIGGANRCFCTISGNQWRDALKNASDTWLDQWPDQTSQLQSNITTLFLGARTLPVSAAPYTLYRLLRLPKLKEDNSDPDDLENDYLIDLVYEDLKRRKIMFVTDWEGLNDPNCCVANAVEVLGLGDEIFKVGEKRITASLIIATALYRPTWIDSGFWLYWMSNPSVSDNCGYTRHLITGAPGAKEWVCNGKPEVKSAKLIHAHRNMDSHRSELPDTYWKKVREWILACR